MESGTAQRVSLVLARDVLHLVLLPTEACNFRCTYCYEDFRLGRMPEQIVRGVERFLSRRAEGLRLLDLSWFGGEPLLARHTVLRILRHVRDLCAANPSLVLRSDMTTNGFLLTPGLFTELHSLGVTRYQVSFDGPPESHDRKRRRRNGTGSFEAIWQNLLAIRSLPLRFTILVRLHLDRDLPAAIEFVDRLRSDFGGDDRFPLFPRLLSRWRSDDKGIDLLTGSAGSAALEEIKCFAGSIGVAVCDAGGTDSICYAARGNSFVIRADGRVNKCTIALDDPANSVGQLTGEGQVILDAAKMGAWMRGLWAGSRETLHCPMIGLAGAGGAAP